MTYNNPNIESLLKIIFSLIDCRIISINVINRNKNDNTEIDFLIALHNNNLKYIPLALDLCKELDVSIKIQHDFKNNFNSLEIEFNQNILNTHVSKLNEFEITLRLQELYNPETKIFICDL